MAKQYQALFLLLSVSCLFSSELTNATVSLVETSTKALNFIQSSCKSTTYQSLCVETLSVYANTIQTSPRRLVDTAIAVSLNQALSTKLFISNLRDSQFGTLADCQPTADVFTTDCTCSVEELQEVVRCNSWTECLFHVNNAEVCAIRAESYSVENSCSNPFSGPVKMSVRGRISQIANWFDTYVNLETVRDNLPKETSCNSSLYDLTEYFCSITGTLTRIAHAR